MNDLNTTNASIHPRRGRHADYSTELIIKNADVSRTATFPSPYCASGPRLQSHFRINQRRHWELATKTAQCALWHCDIINYISQSRCILVVCGTRDCHLQGSISDPLPRSSSRRWRLVLHQEKRTECIWTMLSWLRFGNLLPIYQHSLYKVQYFTSLFNAYVIKQLLGIFK